VSLKIPWGSYRLKYLVPNSNFTISLASAFASFKLLISYNLIYKGRVGHVAFFFLYSPSDNPVARWYENSYMISLSVAYLGRTCGGFSPPNTLTKVPLREAYQSTMFTISSIASWDMQGGSCSKISLYNEMIKWFVILDITPR